jgi:hypothetical protein
MQFFGVHGILQIGDIKYFNAEERAIVDRRGSTSNSKASFFFKPPASFCLLSLFYCGYSTY